MCMPKAPKPPAPPAQRQTMKDPMAGEPMGNDMQRRIRGFSSLVSRAQPSLQPPSTTSTLGG